MPPAATVAAYLKAQPPDRRAALGVVRDAINAALPAGYEERIQYGMISWVVPESVLPTREVYNKQPLALASLGAQKQYLVLHMMPLYGDAAERKRFEAAYARSGRRLDMGKACLRFASLDAIAVDVVAEALARFPVDRYVAAYRKVRPAKTKPARTKPAKAKPATSKGRAKPVARAKKR